MTPLAIDQMRCLGLSDAKATGNVCCVEAKPEQFERGRLHDLDPPFGMDSGESRTHDPASKRKQEGGMTKDRAMRVRDDQNISEIYGNHILGTMFDGATISFTIGTARSLPEKTGDKPAQISPPQVFVTGRVVLTPAAARELVNGIAQMLGVIGGPAPGQKSN